MLLNSCWLKVESPVLYCFVSIYSHSNSIWNKCTAWPKQQQCHVGSPCLSFCNHSIWQDWTQAGESNGFDWDIWRRKFAQQFFFFPRFAPINVSVKLQLSPFSPGFGECGFRHSESNSYHPHGTHCGLLSEDQTASKMLPSASRCHGQERMHAGKICHFSYFLVYVISITHFCNTIL